MLMYIVQTWFWLLLFFVLGAVLAALIVRMRYEPIDEVRAELDRDLALSTQGDLR